MSGLVALLDDVAAIAKVASASMDDVVGQAMKASTKAAGAVIDDAAVTPKYVTGFAASRELPIVWKIARGSLFNKLIILLPALLALQAFLPFMIPVLLMLGGAYLCFEGAEKVWHKLNPSAHHSEELVKEKVADPHLEEKKVKGAVKTDFILSGEIMTITLNALPDDGNSIWFTAAALAIAAVIITAAVYGSVAIIVKGDDVGLHLARNGNTGFGRALGRGIVKAMPKIMTTLVVVGTAAMIWVGGNIIVHGLHELGWHAPYDIIHDIAVGAAASAPFAAGFVEWFVTAFLDGIIGIILGLALIPIVTKLIAPLLSGLFPEKTAAIPN